MAAENLAGTAAGRSNGNNAADCALIIFFVLAYVLA